MTMSSLFGATGFITIGAAWRTCRWCRCFTMSDDETAQARSQDDGRDSFISTCKRFIVRVSHSSDSYLELQLQLQDWHGLSLTETVRHWLMAMHWTERHRLTQVKATETRQTEPGWDSSRQTYTDWDRRRHTQTEIGRKDHCKLR